MKEIFAMALWAKWRADTGTVKDCLLPIRSELAKISAWTRAIDSQGEMVLTFEPAQVVNFIDPLRCSALGALALVSVPEIPGLDCRLCVASAPKEWIENADTVLSFLSRVGMKARFLGRVLEVSMSDGPSDAISKCGVVFLALDRGLRPLVNREVLAKAQYRAVKLFGDASEELLPLLDFEHGQYRQAELFSATAPRWKKSPRERAILEVVKKVSPSAIVQFDCGRGRFLKELALSIREAKVIGVDSSGLRLDGARRNLEFVGEVRCGSVLEPPIGLPDNALALVTDGLSLSSPSRSDRAAEMLFGVIGFEWVLCVESEGNRIALEAWASKATSRYGYRYRGWKLGGSDYAVLLRRPSKHAGNGEFPAWAGSISTAKGTIRISEKQWSSTLESFSKWTVDPRWLLFLPPGMASLQRHREDAYLEHVSDALDYYRGEGIDKVVVEQKHMGSRGITVVCRDLNAARARFGIEELGCIYTRTGRPFFDEAGEMVLSLRDALTRARFWDHFRTDWVCLDGEFLPWSIKADKLIEDKHGELLELSEAVGNVLERALVPMAPAEEFQIRERRIRLSKYRALYGKYEAQRGSEIRFAPFQVVATEGAVQLVRNHLWHMETLRSVVRCSGSPFLETRYQLVDCRDSASVEKCIRWWEKLSDSGEEGLVVKPIYSIPRGRRGFAQPAIKCRGREHLRLVYGPDYDTPEKYLALLDRAALARRRNKHREILKQLTLSVEAVQRFVRRENVERVEECVRGVLALGSQF